MHTIPAEPIRLTQYSHGAGCGCKISPKVLDTILKSETARRSYPALLVGNDTKDDAAVLDTGNGEAIISTTDFFMPIVDDAFDFGRIASTNAISDVYAMGGDPSWPLPSWAFPWTSCRRRWRNKCWKAAGPPAPRRASAGRRPQHRQPGADLRPGR
jgi:selenide,water dikinase